MVPWRPGHTYVCLGLTRLITFLAGKETQWGVYEEPAVSPSSSWTSYKWNTMRGVLYEEPAVSPSSSWQIPPLLKSIAPIDHDILTPQTNNNNKKYIQAQNKIIENNKEDQERKETKDNWSIQTKETKHKITEFFREMNRRHVWVPNDTYSWNVVCDVIYPTATANVIREGWNFVVVEDLEWLD